MGYILMLLNDGDIIILKSNDFRIIYHKSYNIGDDLIENLKNAYIEWEKLKDKEREGKF